MANKKGGKSQKGPSGRGKENRRQEEEEEDWDTDEVDEWTAAKRGEEDGPPYQLSLREREMLEEHYHSDVASMSSGLSPRGEQRRRPWLAGEARNGLANAAELYAQFMQARKEGRAVGPSTAEALRDRVAYEHLVSLAGMNEKVHEAILYNKRIFEMQLARADRAMKQRCFDGWRQQVERRNEKKGKLRKAFNKISKVSQAARAYRCPGP